MADTSLLYSAVYDEVDDALAGLDAVEDLHDQELIGAYDAAVIEKRDGEPHIVKRADRPRARAIPEVVGGGALPRAELHDAAQLLTSGEAALIVVGEATAEAGIDEAVSRAAKVVKRSVEQAGDELKHTFQR